MEVWKPLGRLCFICGLEFIGIIEAKKHIKNVMMLIWGKLKKYSQLVESYRRNSIS